MKRFFLFLLFWLLTVAARAETVPGYLVPFVNAQGYTVTRVTDPGVGVFSDISRHHYMNDQAWSVDGALIKIDKGQSPDLYLDGQTYQPLYARDAPGSSRWSPTIPDTEVYVDGDHVGYWNVRTNQTRVLRTFAGYSDLEFDEGVPSNNGRVVAIAGLNPSGDAVTFAYDLSLDRKWPDIPLPGIFDHARISPVGDLIAVQGGWTADHDDQRKVYTLDGIEVSFFEEKHRPGHEDVIVDSSGVQWTVGRSKDDPDAYMLIKRDLETGEAVVLSEYGPSHTSARNISGEEYVYATYSPGSSSPFAGQVVRFDLDGNYVVLADTHSTESVYEAEAHASASPDGRKVIFASDWGGGGIAAYVIEVTPEPDSIVLVLVFLLTMAVFFTGRRFRHGRAA